MGANKNWHKGRTGMVDKIRLNPVLILIRVRDVRVAEEQRAGAAVVSGIVAHWRKA
jgi:hypothetical protein